MRSLEELVSLSRSEMTDVYNEGNRDPIEDIRFDKKAASSFSASRREKRHLITDVIFPDGYNTYDLHSAGIAIQRLMNTGEFDPDYDIKDDIEKMTHADRTLIKQVLVKTQYHKDRENVKQSVERHNPDLDMTQFDDVYDAFIEIIGPEHGDVSLYGTEAEIEILTNIRLRDMGYHTANVFDCFYSEAPEDVIKKTLTEVAHAYYRARKGIKESLRESRIVALREGQSPHTVHIEDEFLKGPDALQRMMGFFNYIFGTLEGSASNDHPPVSQKIDGGPVIFVWTSFPGLGDGPGCAGKGLLNKTPIFFNTAEEITNSGIPEGLKTKLYPVLQFAHEKAIPPNQVWMGDMLFSEGDAQTYEHNGEKMIYVKPVTIVYAAPYDSELGKKFRTCKMGAVFHTRFTGDLEHKTNDVSISELTHIPDWAFIKDAQIKDMSGKVSFNKQESDQLKSDLASLQKIVDKVSKHAKYQKLVDNDQFVEFYIMTLQNHKVDEKTPVDPVTFIGELHDWIDAKMDKERVGISKLKTETGKQKKASLIDVKTKELHTLVENNRDLINDIAEGLALATEIKGDFIAKMNEANEWIQQVEMKDGFHNTEGEGFIASDYDGNFVKLVDRSAFSFFARSPEVIKGAAHSSSRKQKEGADTAVVIFGRMNPPSIGHVKLAETIKQIADAKNGDAFVYLSHSYDGKDSDRFTLGKVKNPLKYDDKIAFVKDAIGHLVTVQQSTINGTFEVYGDLYQKGYNNLVVVGGADRVEQFKRDAQGHNGKPDIEPLRYFNFKSIDVISAGDRDEDSDDPATQASASLLRKFVAANDFENFQKYCGTKRLAKPMFDKLKYEMGIGGSLKEEQGKENAPEEDYITLEFASQEEADAAVRAINDEAKERGLLTERLIEKDVIAQKQVGDWKFTTKKDAMGFLDELKSKYSSSSYSAELSGSSPKFYVQVKKIDKENGKTEVKAETKKAVDVKKTSSAKSKPETGPLDSNTEFNEKHEALPELLLKVYKGIPVAMQKMFGFSESSKSSTSASTITMNVFKVEDFDATGKTYPASDSEIRALEGSLTLPNKIDGSSESMFGVKFRVKLAGKERDYKIYFRETGGKGPCRPYYFRNGEVKLSPPSTFETYSATQKTQLSEAITAYFLCNQFNGKDPAAEIDKVFESYETFTAFLDKIEFDKRGNFDKSPNVEETISIGFSSFKGAWLHSIKIITNPTTAKEIKSCYANKTFETSYIPCHPSMRINNSDLLFDRLRDAPVAGAIDSINPTDIYLVRKDAVKEILNFRSANATDYILQHNNFLHTKKVISVSLKQLGKGTLFANVTASHNSTSKMMNSEKGVFLHLDTFKNFTLEKPGILDESTSKQGVSCLIHCVGKDDNIKNHLHMTVRNNEILLDIRKSSNQKDLLGTPSIEATASGLSARLGKGSAGVPKLIYQFIKQFKEELMGILNLKRFNLIINKLNQLRESNADLNAFTAMFEEDDLTYAEFKRTYRSELKKRFGNINYVDRLHSDYGKIKKAEIDNVWNLIDSEPSLNGKFDYLNAVRNFVYGYTIFNNFKKNRNLQFTKLLALTMKYKIYELDASDMVNQTVDYIKIY